jgi:hypothetical protein
LLALAVSRGCASSAGQISQERAVEIAKREIDYEPDRTQVRLIRRGVPNSRAFWAVSLARTDGAGRIERVTVVVVDARTETVAEVRESDQ